MTPGKKAAVAVIDVTGGVTILLAIVVYVSSLPERRTKDQLESQIEALQYEQQSIKNQLEIILDRN